jgi:hypothetical protein
VTLCLRNEYLRNVLAMGDTPGEYGNRVEM